jgi:Ca-activated chloride channel family protein
MDRMADVLNVIAGQLKSGDIVSMVEWSETQTAILSDHSVSGADDPVLLSAIAGLESGGGTDLSGGLRAGYVLAAKNYSTDQINRIVLISDGGANMGTTDATLIGQHAGTQDADGIYMVGIGVDSSASYNDRLMDEVTDLGKGASLFIDSLEEAERMLGDRFVSTMDVWARDVSVVLDLPPGFEIVKFSGEEYSTDPTEIEPQHLAPSDAMVFYQTIRSCAPEDVTDETELSVSVLYRDGLTFETGSESLTATFGALSDGDTAQLYKGAAIYAYAEGLKALRRAEDREAVLARLEAALDRAAAENADDPELATIRALVERL